MINWDSSESHVFVNPRSSFSLLPSDWEHYGDYPGHVWVSTSGTVSSGEKGVKWVALPKKGFLVSAQALNAHLQCTSSDLWMKALPSFHVGGLAIYARAKLSGSAVDELALPKWCPHAFMKRILASKSTLTSLVPTQIFDLIQAAYSSPPILRVVLVGGGAFQEKLYSKARELKWPVIPTYAMTECCSSIATGNLGDPSLKILPHLRHSLSPEGLLQIESDSLLTGYLWISSTSFIWEDPKKEGVFTTEDRVEIKEGILHFCGRIHDWIKISGENVSMYRLERHFESYLPLGSDACLFHRPDVRLGYRIEVAFAKGQEKEVEEAVQSYNATVMPYERIRAVHPLDQMPRNALGKVIKGELQSGFLKRSPMNLMSNLNK